MCLPFCWSSSIYLMWMVLTTYSFLAALIFICNKFIPSLCPLFPHFGLSFLILDSLSSFWTLFPNCELSFLAVWWVLTFSRFVDFIAYQFIFSLKMMWKNKTDSNFKKPSTSFLRLISTEETNRNHSLKYLRNLLIMRNWNLLLSNQMLI